MSCRGSKKWCFVIQCGAKAVSARKGLDRRNQFVIGILDIFTVVDGHDVSSGRACAAEEMTGGDRYATDEAGGL